MIHEFFRKTVFIALAAAAGLVFFGLMPFAEAQGPTGVQAAGAEIPAEILEENFIYDSHGRRDPFVSLIEKPGFYEKKVEVSEDGKVEVVEIINLHVNLEGIVWDAEDPLALIDDRIVRINEEYDEMKILKIETQSVLILYKDVEFWFYISDDEMII